MFGTRRTHFTSTLLALAATGLICSQPTFAAPDRTLTVSSSSAVATWDGAAASGANTTWFITSQAGLPPAGVCGKETTNYCEDTLVNADVAASPGAKLKVTIDGFAARLPPTEEGFDDFDVFIFKSDAAGTVGEFVAAGHEGAGTPEVVTIDKASGFYLVRIVYFLVVDAGYKGTLELTRAAPAGATASAPVSPLVTWTGEVSGSLAAQLLVYWTGDDSVPCEAPACDAFTFTLPRSADLTIGANLESDPVGEVTGQVTLRIRKPDGSVVVASSSDQGISRNNYFTVLIRSAAAGAYTVEYWNSNPLPESKYSGYAQIPKAAAPAASGPTRASAPGPTGGAAPEPVQPIDLTVTTGKASARRLKRARKLRATITVSRPVKSVVAKLQKGSKVIGTARRGPTAGTAKLALRISKEAARKLKKGTYTLSVRVSNGQSATTKPFVVRVGK